MSAAARTAWPLDALHQALAPLLPGFAAEVLASIDSTNSELMRRARAGRDQALLLVAEQQSAGRGRMGRPWRSGAQQRGAPASLTFSLGLPLAPRDWSGLSLAAGVGVAEALAPAVRLKWPNDLWLADGRKLGGILVETASFGHDARAGGRYVIVGVGINVLAPSADGLSTPPACLHEIDPRLDAATALARIAAPLAHALLGFAAHGFAPFGARFAARDVLRGRSVTLSDGSSGTALGVADDGALHVMTHAGVRCVTSSEVSVRPSAAHVP